MEACRFSYYTVWLTLKVRQWPVEVTSWNQSTSSLQSPTILSEEKKDCRQMDSRLSRVSTRAPGYAFVCVAAVYLLLSSERLCLQTNRKIVCQPAHGIYTHEPDFCKISFTVQSMWVDRPPPILCRSPFFFPFFLVSSFALCSFICPFISFRRSVDAAERDGSRKELGAERLVTFPAGAMSSSQIESEHQWDCKLYAAPTNFMDMDYAREGGEGSRNLTAKKVKRKEVQFRYQFPVETAHSPSIPDEMCGTQLRLDCRNEPNRKSRQTRL